MTTAELRAVARDTIAIYERIVAHRERLTAANTAPHHTPRLNVIRFEEEAGRRAELARAYLALVNRCTCTVVSEVGSPWLVLERDRCEYCRWLATRGTA